MDHARDPFQAYLLKAETLYLAGDVVQAGQIWQAILKKNPNHSDARAGLYKVKLYFDARATQDGMTPMEDFALEQTATAPPAMPASAPELSRGDEIERLLRDGCTLFDMGESASALRKWEQVLELDPQHPLALGYVRDAKRDLGLATSDNSTMALPLPAPAAPEPPPAPTLPQGERIEQLLREGTQLYDMGMSAEAEAKWQQVLDWAPDHKDALAYLAMARRDQAAPTATTALPPPATQAPPPSAAPAAPTPVSPSPPDMDPKLRNAEALLHQGRLEEAGFLFQQVLEVLPHNFRALQGLRQATTLLDAKQHSHVAADTVYPTTPPIPWAEPEPAAMEAQEPEPEAIAPPSQLTTPPPPARKGLDVPHLVRQLEGEVPGWLKTPKALGALVGTIVVVYSGFLWFRAHRKDVLLRNAVQDFRTASQAPVARSLDIAGLSEDPAAVRRQAEEFLEKKPLLAYYRAQELIRLNALDGPAAQLMGQASSAMAKEPAAGQGSLAEAQKLLAKGELDAAHTMLFGLLKAAPDDAELKGHAARLSLCFAETYALKERWDDAEEHLQTGRMMFPTDKSWAARLQLLQHLKTLPAAQRAAWLCLLG